mmetsp:Transcript_4409/g.9449  ORF Transcript_4409/g.9449 Transcript_4409/m.9449 type:complete len:679 (-) Transcript_4409:66-2102(-)|eukprot:CAMPEP_0172449384 /NCGR_PEP_ID=MMETSP1065-20121228/8111_1 /TAXON_ID=265537 /ORGANISM="Amphiprora paludosa, Strain CCMP125" /LENGTH=678 /DNA_ID=CAMNT_0013201051 /DNA_START=81 /DNA_END=2117 /DNA_ORIENTATION=-
MPVLDPEETFASLADSAGLDYRVKKALARLGFVRPTLVQSKCLPLALNSGRDLLVRAKTGSGKTLAYTVPLLHKLLQRKEQQSVGAVILVPTRELCSQLQTTLKELTYYCDDVLSTAVLSVGQARGDKSKRELLWQESMLRDNPAVIIATPAGLLRHIRSGALKGLNESVETLVVDEADLVLSFGYSKEIAEIVKALPRICQSFLMSATLSPEVDSLKKIMLNSPVVLKLEDEEGQGDGQSTGKLKQFFLEVPKKDKNLVIYVFIKLGLLKGKGLFFVNTTDAGYRLKLFLEQFHVRSAVLNAELPFRSRMNIIEQFNMGNFDFLIATDTSTDVPDSLKEMEDEEEAENDSDEEQNVGKQSKKRTKDSEYGVARGLDFKGVSFVLNADFPPNARSYAHRVGRTARGGAKGVALSLVEAESFEQRDCLAAVQDDQPSIPLVGASTETLHAAASGSTHEKKKEAGNLAASPKEQAQPTPLDFDLREIEGFRYRVEDVSRAVTKASVREARAAELRAEIVNSERLQSHFEENPADLQLLQHDRLATHSSRVHEHLGNVPTYLLPHGMQVAKLNKKKRKRARKQLEPNRTEKDPLKKFDAVVESKGDESDGGEDPFAEFMEDDVPEQDTKKQKVDEDPRIYANAQDGTGKSTAGRNKWKQRHKKGKYSVRKTSTKRRAALGI